MANLPIKHVLELKLASKLGWTGRYWKVALDGLHLFGYPPGSKEVMPIPKWATNPTELHGLLDQYDLQLICKAQGYFVLPSNSCETWTDEIQFTGSFFADAAEAVLAKVIEIVPDMPLDNAKTKLRQMPDLSSV